MINKKPVVFRVIIRDNFFLFFGGVFFFMNNDRAGKALRVLRPAHITTHSTAHITTHSTAHRNHRRADLLRTLLKEPKPEPNIPIKQTKSL